MKVLVATSATQGSRGSDVAGCIDGELLFMIEPCEGSQRRPYGPCDCGRTFRGLVTDGVTSTAVVRDLDDLTQEDLVEALKSRHARVQNCTCDFTAAELMADELLDYASHLPEGAVVERRLDWLQVRGPAKQRRSR